MGHFSLEDSGNAQCTPSTSVVLKHAVPPLLKKITMWGMITTNNGFKINGVQRAGGMGQVKPAGLQG